SNSRVRSWRRLSWASSCDQAVWARPRSLSSRWRPAPAANSGAASRIHAPMAASSGRDAVDGWFGKGRGLFLPPRSSSSNAGGTVEVRRAREFLFVLCKSQEETGHSLSNREPSFLSTLLHVTWLGPLAVSAAHFFLCCSAEQAPRGILAKPAEL